MRIGIIADVHCNLHGLERALEDMGPVDEILCAGDVVYEYRLSNEVLDLIRQRGIRMVLGNHEAVILSRDGEKALLASAPSLENLRFLQDTTTILRLNLDGKSILVVHGSPWDPLHEYLYERSENLPRLSQVDADIVILGHTHYPMIKQVGGVLVINPGSCGEARDPRYHFQLTYAILDIPTGEAVIRTIEDPDQSRAWTPETE